MSQIGVTGQFIHPLQQSGWDWCCSNKHLLNLHGMQQCKFISHLYYMQSWAGCASLLYHPLVELQVGRVASVWDVTGRIAGGKENMASHVFPLSFCWKENSVHHLPIPFSSVQFMHSVVSNSAIPWTAVRQTSLSITSFQSLLKLMSIESVMPSNHLILCHPLLPPAFSLSQHQDLF